jgi:hypothetical protein
MPGEQRVVIVKQYTGKQYPEVKYQNNKFRPAHSVRPLWSIDN